MPFSRDGELGPVCIMSSKLIAEKNGHFCIVPCESVMLAVMVNTTASFHRPSDIYEIEKFFKELKIKPRKEINELKINQQRVCFNFFSSE